MASVMEEDGVRQSSADISLHGITKSCIINGSDAEAWLSTIEGTRWPNCVLEQEDDNTAIESRPSGEALAKAVLSLMTGRAHPLLLSYLDAAMDAVSERSAAMCTVQECASALLCQQLHMSVQAVREVCALLNAKGIKQWLSGCNSGVKKPDVGTSNEEKQWIEMVRLLRRGASSGHMVIVQFAASLLSLKARLHQAISGQEAASCSTLIQSEQSEGKHLPPIKDILGQMLKLFETMPKHSTTLAHVQAGPNVTSEASYQSEVQSGLPSDDFQESSLGWRASAELGESDTCPIVEPEVAVLLHMLVDEPSDLSTSVCAVQMLIDARRSSGCDARTAYLSAYYGLLSGAAGACSVVVSTPKAFGGGETDATLWCSTLCGLIPSIIAHLEKARKECLTEFENKASTDAAHEVDNLVDEAVQMLFKRAAQTLEQCEITLRHKATEQSNTDGDSVMLDAMINDASHLDPPDRPLRAAFIQSLKEKGLITPHEWKPNRQLGATIEAADARASSSFSEARQASLALDIFLEQKIAAGAAEDGAFLCRLIDDYAAQETLSNALLKAIHDWVTSSDVDSLSRACATFLNHETALHVWLLYVSPASVLDALTPILNNTDILQSGDEPSALGSVMIFAQFVVHLAVGAGATLEQVLPRRPDHPFPCIMRAITATRLLESLAKTDQGVIANWITALFGSDGISDDLIRSSSPQLLLRITPTIFAQVITAAVNEVIDGETLRSGLTYFLQGLLSYTLPGALCSLLQDIERCHVSRQLNSSGTASDANSEADIGSMARRRKICIDVLCSLLQAESCPVTVKKLVATKVVSVLERCKPLPSEAEMLLTDLRVIAVDQQRVRKIDTWIKVAQASTRPSLVDPLLNLNASLYAVAAQRGHAALVSVFHKTIGQGSSTFAVQRAVAFGIGLSMLRESDGSTQDLCESSTFRVACALLSNKPSKAVCVVLDLVCQLALALDADAMKSLHRQLPHPAAGVASASRSIAEAITVLDRLAKYSS